MFHISSKTHTEIEVFCEIQSICRKSNDLSCRMFNPPCEWARIKDGACVSSSSPGGGIGGEVCRLPLYLVDRTVHISSVTHLLCTCIICDSLVGCRCFEIL